MSQHICSILEVRKICMGGHQRSFLLLCFCSISNKVDLLKMGKVDIEHSVQTFPDRPDQSQAIWKMSGHWTRIFILKTRSLNRNPIFVTNITCRKRLPVSSKKPVEHWLKHITIYQYETKTTRDEGKLRHMKIAALSCVRSLCNVHYAQGT